MSVKGVMVGCKGHPHNWRGCVAIPNGARSVERVLLECGTGTLERGTGTLRVWNGYPKGLPVEGGWAEHVRELCNQLYSCWCFVWLTGPWYGAFSDGPHTL